MMTQKFKQEVEFNNRDDFKKGDYLYIGMATVNEHKMCISVGYTIEYSHKKLKQAINAIANPNISDVHISKVRVGETEKIDSFEV